MFRAPLSYDAGQHRDALYAKSDSVCWPFFTVAKFATLTDLQHLDSNMIACIATAWTPWLYIATSFCTEVLDEATAHICGHCEGFWALKKLFTPSTSWNVWPEVDRADADFDQSDCREW